MVLYTYCLNKICEQHWYSLGEQAMAIDHTKDGVFPRMPHPMAVWLLSKGLSGLCQHNKYTLPGMALLCHLVQGWGPTPSGKFPYFRGSESHSSTSGCEIPAIPTLHAYDPF